MQQTNNNENNKNKIKISSFLFSFFEKATSFKTTTTNKKVRFVQQRPSITDAPWLCQQVTNLEEKQQRLHQGLPTAIQTFSAVQKKSELEKGRHPRSANVQFEWWAQRESGDARLSPMTELFLLSVYA